MLERRAIRSPLSIAWSFALAIFYGSPGAAADRGPEPNLGTVPVLVELFTSEGCSSCPPADAALLTLTTEHVIPGVDVIALEEHVDYWNHLGWKDPFSSSAFSLRQEAYGQAFGTKQIYTPQMIVDGRMELVGSDVSRGRQAMADATRSPKIPMRIVGTPNASAGDLLTVHIESAPFEKGPDRPELWVAITEEGLSTDVRGGENGGRRLRHGPVVRALQMVGDFGPKPTADAQFRMAKDWNRERLRIVAFVQERASRRVVGVTASPLRALW